jgi:hypothetical protein
MLRRDFGRRRRIHDDRLRPVQDDRRPRDAVADLEVVEPVDRRFLSADLAKVDARRPIPPRLCDIVEVEPLGLLEDRRPE